MINDPKSAPDFPVAELTQNGRKWNNHAAFVLTVLSRYRLNIYEDEEIHPADIGDGIKSWNEDDWTLAIDEGRRQLEIQFAQLQLVTRRASTLLSIGIASLLFLFTNLFDDISQESLPACIIIIVRIIFITGSLMVAWGTVVMGAIIGARSRYGLSDALLLTRESTGLRRYLAWDYARLVPTGHNTNAALLTHLGTGIAWMVGGGILGVISLLISYFGS